MSVEFQTMHFTTFFEIFSGIENKTKKKQGRPCIKSAPDVLVAAKTQNKRKNDQMIYNIDYRGCKKWLYKYHRSC